MTSPVGARELQTTALIVAGIAETLTPLRAGQMRVPHVVDHTARWT